MRQSWVIPISTGYTQEYPSLHTKYYIFYMSTRTLVQIFSATARILSPQIIHYYNSQIWIITIINIFLLSSDQLYISSKCFVCASGCHLID
jgi:hypothetical protein